MTPGALAWPAAVPWGGPAIAPNPAVAYLERLAPGSRPAMRSSLNLVARLASDGRDDLASLEWASLTVEDTLRVRAEVVAGYAPATAARHLSALRGALRTARRLGLMDAAACEEACDLAPPPGTRLPAGRALGAGELMALVEACRRDPRPIGARDEALIALMARAGLRRQEVVRIGVEDLDLEAGEVRVRHAKRGRERVMPLPGSATAWLGRWRAVRGGVPGPLMLPVDRRGVPRLRAMSPGAVRDAVRRRAAQAGLGDVANPHDLRRTYITDLLTAGVDVFTVQRLADHHDPAVTARYDRRGDEVRRRAVGLLDPEPQPTR